MRLLIWLPALMAVAPQSQPLLPPPSLGAQTSLEAQPSQQEQPSQQAQQGITESEYLAVLEREDYLPGEHLFDQPDRRIRHHDW